MVVGRQSFPIGKVTFQGRAVQLREGTFPPRKYTTKNSPKLTMCDKHHISNHIIISIYNPTSRPTSQHIYHIFTNQPIPLSPFNPLVPRHGMFVSRLPLHLECSHGYVAPLRWSPATLEQRKKAKNGLSFHDILVVWYRDPYNVMVYYNPHLTG